MLFNLVFVNNTVLPCFFMFFLIIDLCFLIAAVIAQNFNPITGIVIPITIQVKNQKQLETHSVTAEAKTRKCSI